MADNDKNNVVEEEEEEEVPGTYNHG